MNLGVIVALVRKDITLYFRNRFFAFITVIGLAAYIGIFFLMPSDVDESLTMGYSGPSLPPEMVADITDGGVIFNTYSDETSLRAAVEGGDEPVGIVLPPDFFHNLLLGERTQASVYFHATLPDEFREAYSLFLSELSFMLAGKPLNIESEEIILGPDMAGEQISPRMRMLPMLAVIILMMETFGLASLIAAEVETGALRALLATPLSVAGLFLSKGTTGVLLAFTQVAILMAVVGGFQNQPLLIAFTLLLGSILITGLSLMIASVSRDMTSVMGWGMLALILLAIPSFNLLLPGLTTDWIRVIPSHYLVDTIYRVINFDASWSQVRTNLVVLLAFSIGFFGLGMVVLGRKLQ
jgi:ABC-2 type transport system permease protein